MKNKYIYFQKVKSKIQNLTKERNIFELELLGIQSALRKIRNEYHKINLGIDYKHEGNRHKSIPIEDELIIYDKCLNACPHFKDEIFSTLLTVKNHDYIKDGLDEKKQYKKDLRKVKKNYKMYPLLLYYMRYIKEEILRDKLVFRKNKIYDIDVFRYIADIIRETESMDKKKLITRIKGYYDQHIDIFKK